ncbi:MAG TPA: class I SAM-dependent methyltransferase [Acidobacteriota bacterium]|nr:class I SAM-dependent methyltransferase [Acidobacteriota bacterium]
MNPFTYEFGYGWAWNYGHLIAIVPFALLALMAWNRNWSRWVLAPATAVAVWGVAGLLIVQFAMRVNLPMELPTENFLSEGAGRVLDAGAGSGRSSLMVLQARPDTQVVALDLYDGYYGIADNTPDRLMANAAIAGVEDRITAQAGDMREMPFEDSSFDAAVSAYAIDHLSREGMKNSLSEVHRVLRPQGEFLLIVINPDIWIRVAYPFFVHHGYYGGRTDHERWRSRVIEAGFEVTEMGTTPGTLYLLARKPAQPLLPTTARH